MATHDDFATYDPYEFEHFVADVWEAQGWTTDVRQASGDAGIDIVARRSAPVDETHVIQAKRYTGDNKVGGPEIQQYAALRQQVPDADAVVVVTSTGFTRAARDRARELNVKLVDGPALRELADRHGVDGATELPARQQSSADVAKVAQTGVRAGVGLGTFAAENLIEVFKAGIVLYVLLKFVDVLVFNVPLI